MRIVHNRGMKSNIDLASASRDSLLALIAEQQTALAQYEQVIAQQHEQIAQLHERVEALQARLMPSGGSSPMPGLKPAATRKAPRNESRKRRSQGSARRRSIPTETVTHAVERCPDCGTALAGGWVKRTRQVIELPPVQPVRVVEHQFIARACPHCRKRHVAKAALGSVVLGKQRFGIGLVSLILTLREAGRLPLETIQWYLQTLHQLDLSVGGIARVIEQAATHVEPTVQAIQEQVRASPVVCADETGWREDGVNGYVWTFSTPTEQYLLRRGRNKEVVDEVLGPTFSGVLVSDFYAAYHHYPGIHQRCWAHLLRDNHDLTTAFPQDEALRTWATAVHTLYQDATTFTSSDERTRLQKQRELEGRLLALCQPFLIDETAVQGKLCRRIERHLKELFVFVADPQVPPTNNLAERSLRHLVTSRKISGGTRSAEGTTAKMTWATLFGTWRLRGLHPLDQCRQRLLSPQL